MWYAYFEMETQPDDIDRQCYRYEPEEIDLVLRTIIDTDTIAAAIVELERIANSTTDEDAPTARSVIDWINQTEQKPRNRCLYDIRRRHYDRLLEILLVEKAVPRVAKIIRDGDDTNAQKTFDKLHDIVKGKPTQPIEVTGFVTQGEVQKAIEAEAIKSPHGIWVNPETVLEPAATEEAG